MAARQTRGCPSTGRCQVTLTMLKHRRSGRSGVCGLSNARWLWHLERFSAPPPAQKLSISCAKLTRSLSIQSKGGPAKVRCRPLRYLFAPVPLACRTSRATTIPRRYQQSRLCDGRRVRADGFLHVNARAQCPGTGSPRQPHRGRGVSSISIGERAASRTRRLCAHSPAASRASPATAAPDMRWPVRRRAEPARTISGETKQS